MKYLLLLSFIWFGCADYDNKLYDKPYSNGLTLATVDSCEYVLLYGDAIVHSGNCHNQKHLKQ